MCYCVCSERAPSKHHPRLKQLIISTQIDFDEKHFHYINPVPLPAFNMNKLKACTFKMKNGDWKKLTIKSFKLVQIVLLIDNCSLSVILCSCQFHNPIVRKKATGDEWVVNLFDVCTERDNWGCKLNTNAKICHKSLWI